MAHEDWMPTLSRRLATRVTQKLLEGYSVGDKTFKNHLDGYKLLSALLQGPGSYSAAPRDLLLRRQRESQRASHRRLEISFKIMQGNIAAGHIITQHAGP